VPHWWILKRPCCVAAGKRKTRTRSRRSSIISHQCISHRHNVANGVRTFRQRVNWFRAEKSRGRQLPRPPRLHSRLPFPSCVSSTLMLSSYPYSMPFLAPTSTSRTSLSFARGKPTRTYLACSSQRSSLCLSSTCNRFCHLLRIEDRLYRATALHLRPRQLL
jgi:hypothetical protein